MELRESAFRMSGSFTRLVALGTIGRALRRESGTNQEDAWNALSGLHGRAVQSGNIP